MSTESISAAPASSATPLGPAAADHVKDQILRRVRHFLAEPSSSVYQDLKGICERVSDSYRERVIIELLQNAHDAHPSAETDGRIKIVLDRDEGEHGTLRVANNGHGFTAKNFDALCSPTRTTKTVNEAIGNKGVGFLSVFQVCGHPEIYSRRGPGSSAFDGYCFGFGDDDSVRAFLKAEGLAADAAQVLASMPRLYLACPIAFVPDSVRRLEAEGFTTVIRLPLKSADAYQSVAQQIKQLTGDGPPVQLFLTRIADLSVVASGAPAVRLLRGIERRWIDGRRHLLRLVCGSRRYIVVQTAIRYDDVISVITKDVAADRLPDSWLRWEGDAVVSIAVPADGPPIEGRLYNFLPMGVDARAPLAGHLDAPFYASMDRLRLQVEVGLNELLLKTARDLGLQGARLAKTRLSGQEARRAATDFICWAGQDANQIRAVLLGSEEPLVPTLSKGVPDGWAALSNVRVWRGDDFVSPQYASRVSSFSFADPALGTGRLAALAAFAAARVECNAEERAEIAERIALDLEKRRAASSRWDSFYRSLARLFANDSSALAGRRLLLSARGELHETERPDGDDKRPGNRRRKLSAAFLPPLRGGEGSARAVRELPRAVQRRFAYLAPTLELARNRSSPERRFLVTAGLVREYESREVLRLLGSAIAEPGDVKDPDELRWEALTAMMRIVTDESTADGIVADLNPLLPTREGWSRANTAYFSGRWAGAASADLENLFEQAKGLSAELDEQAARLLKPYADWRVSAHDRPAWLEFLRKAGVSDRLRPLPAIAGPAPHGYSNDLPHSLVQRVRLPPDQAQAWLAMMQEQTTPPNPLTAYSASGVYRLPGQLDYAALAPVGHEYAVQVIRAIDARPDVAAMTIFQPQYPGRYERLWPSPVTAFVQGVEWIPLASSNFAFLRDAWLPATHGRTPPRGLPIVDHDVVGALMRSEQAAKRLKEMGLSEFGDWGHSWRFLKAAGQAVARDAEQRDAEHFLAVARDAWLHADLKVPPPKDLRILGRRPGAVVAFALDVAEEPSLLVADGDDRQLVAARVRCDPQAVVFDPPPSRAAEIGAYLAARFPSRVRRASEIEATYECDGKRVQFDPRTPFLNELLGEGVREIVTLSLYYRNSFYRRDLHAVLQELGRVRLRWLPALSLRVGELLEPVPSFAERAVLLNEEDGPTLLAHSSLQGSDRVMIGIAGALGAALGSRRQIGEPLVALAAQLGENPLACDYEDYARALDVPVEDIRGLLGASRASIGNVLWSLRPFVVLFAGYDAGRDFVPGSRISTDDDLIRVLTESEEELPVPVDELLGRCREGGGVEAVAIALRVDLSRLNAVLERLGPPYAVIDLTERHSNTLAHYLDRREVAIRESIRAAYCNAFESGEDMSAYVAARDAARPTLPPGFGKRSTELPNSEMSSWLEAWLKGMGVTLIVSPPSGRHTLEATREANRRYLRELAPTMRVAVLSRCDGHSALRATYADTDAAATALVTAATKGGWADFRRLDEMSALAWASRAALWPDDWPKSIADLRLTNEERAAIEAADERAKAAALAKYRTIEYTGGTFKVGVDSIADLSTRIAELVRGNSALLNTPTRTLGGRATSLPARPLVGRAAGGGGGGVVARLSEGERDVIGYFGEAIAFDWLKRRFGEKRVVDLSCWKSNYRRHLAGENGNDMLGYDFEIRNGGTTWFFEVKATSGDSTGSRQMIELGSSEIAHAEVCRGDKRMRYRILYVVNALRPEAARIFVLPNPRSVAGRGFFADLQSAGIRLAFPLPSGD